MFQDFSFNSYKGKCSPMFSNIFIDFLVQFTNYFLISIRGSVIVLQNNKGRIYPSFNYKSILINIVYICTLFHEETYNRIYCYEVVEYKIVSNAHFERNFRKQQEVEVALNCLLYS